jgi:hypothetical protein
MTLTNFQLSVTSCAIELSEIQLICSRNKGLLGKTVTKINQSDKNQKLNFMNRSIGFQDAYIQNVSFYHIKNVIEGKTPY